MARTDTVQKRKDVKKPKVGTPGSQPNKIMSDHPDENVDQDGHCITPAYAESTTLNSGEPCDDGRAGK